MAVAKYEVTTNKGKTVNWSEKQILGQMGERSLSDEEVARVSKLFGGAAPEPERARDEAGHFVADDPSTPDVNEAFVEPEPEPEPEMRKAKSDWQGTITAWFKKESVRRRRALMPQWRVNGTNCARCGVQVDQYVQPRVAQPPACADCADAVKEAAS